MQLEILQNRAQPCRVRSTWVDVGQAGRSGAGSGRNRDTDSPESGHFGSNSTALRTTMGRFGEQPPDVGRCWPDLGWANFDRRLPTFHGIDRDRPRVGQIWAELRRPSFGKHSAEHRPNSPIVGRVFCLQLGPPVGRRNHDNSGTLFEQRRVIAQERSPRNFSECRPPFTDNAHFDRDLHKFGQTLPEFGQNWPGIGQVSPEVGLSRPTSARNRHTRLVIDQTWRIWPSLARSRQPLACA